MVDLDLAPSGAAYSDDAAPMELGRFFAGGSTKRCRAYGAEVGRAVLCAPVFADGHLCQRKGAFWFTTTAGRGLPALPHEGNGNTI